MKKDIDPMQDYSNFTDEQFVNRQDEIFSYISHIIKDDEALLLNELCDIERELTLKEE